MTILGNSDVHPPVNLAFNLSNGKHRPMTLVFAENRSEKAIKEALFNKRTAVYFNDLLMGAEKYLKPIVDQAIEILNPAVSIKGTGRATIQIQNRSNLLFELISENEIAEISIPDKIKLYPDKTIIFQINGKSKNQPGKKKISIPFTIKNLLITPEQRLTINLSFEVNFIAEQ